MRQQFLTRNFGLKAFAVVLPLLLVGCESSRDMEVAVVADTLLLLSNHTPDPAAVSLVARECAVATNEEIDREPPSEWRAFRSAHPYHIQAVALGNRSRDGSRLLLISEPPPWVCASTLRELAPEFRTLRIHEWQVGYNGWVRDITVRLPDLDSLSLGLLLQDVHRILFGTTYKAETLPIRSATRKPTDSLDFSVSAAELKRWLVLDDERFSGRGVGHGYTVRDLLSHRAYGIHFSTVPGLVVWVLPRNENIASSRIDARRWALDTDLILGGVADGGSVAVIARERTIPLDVLPPLRVETILQLAAVETDHLAQSYERNFALAGRTADNDDWAPIYLSPELIDTEYGSLLNITDQMLKSWSQHGQIKYVHFGYPSPGRYPFTQPLSEELKSSVVTFNWNTTGAGYVAEDDGLAVYALNRTGALPVSYFAGDDQEANAVTRAAERRGYTYFAQLRDPNLARVVQYAALYQLFRTFGVQANVQSPPDPSNPREGLRKQILETIVWYVGFDTLGFYNIEDAAVQRELIEAHRAVSHLSRTFGQASLERIAGRLVSDPGDISLQLSDAERNARIEQSGGIKFAIPADALAALEQSTAEKLQRVFPMLTSEEEVRHAMQVFAEASPRPSRPWIHTAAVVRSRNVQNAEFVGGHNLDAAVTRFRADPGLPSGSVRVSNENGIRVILANEDDIVRMSSEMRTVATAQNERALQSHLSTLLQRGGTAAIRARRVAVPAPTRTLRRGLVEQRNTVTVGYENVARDFTPVERASSAFLRAQERSYTGVTKLSDGAYEIVLGNSGEIVRAPNLVAALDVVAEQSYAAGPGAVRQVQLYRFDELGANTFRRNVENTLRRRGKADPERVTTIVRRSGTDEHVALQGATRKLDLQTAEVTLVREAHLEINGVLHRAYQVDVRVATQAIRQPLLVRIWIIFRDGVARPAMEAVRLRVAQILNALGRDVPADLAAAIIRKELRESFGSIDMVQTHLDDVVLAYVPATADAHLSNLAE